MKQTRQRVVHLSTVHTARDTRIFQRECRSLAAYGFEVHLVAPRSVNVATEDGMVDGVDIHQFPRRQGHWSRATRVPYRLYRTAMRLRADVYHFHDPELIPMGLALRARGKRVVYDVHENVPEQVREAPWLPRPIRPLLGWTFDRFEKWAARRFSGVAAANPAIYARFAGLPIPVIKLRNYPLLEEYPVSDTPAQMVRDQNRLVAFGGISHHTCTDTISAALALLPDMPEVRLTLGGRVCSDALYREIVHAAGWERVDYVGKVPREQVTTTLFGAAAALVLYSPDQNHYSIGSNRFFEALAAGLPVITSDFPEWKQTVTEIGCGLPVDPTDPRAIADAVRYLVSHPAEAAAMGERGKRAVREEMNWEREQAKLFDLYEQVLTHPHTQDFTPVELRKLGSTADLKRNS